jgi:hypothetical protein
MFSLSLGGLPTSMADLGKKADEYVKNMDTDRIRQLRRKLKLKEASEQEIHRRLDIEYALRDLAAEKNRETENKRADWMQRRMRAQGEKSLPKRFWTRDWKKRNRNSSNLNLK